MSLDKGIKKFEKQEYIAALQFFDAELKKNSKETNVLYYRSICYRRINRLHESLQDIENALFSSPTNADFLSEKAVTLLHLNRKEESLTFLHKAVLLDSQNPYRYSSRAFVLDSLGKVQEAIEDYKKAIELDPEDSVSHNNLGLLQEKQGRIQDANFHFNKANAIVGYDPEKSAKSKSVEVITEPVVAQKVTTSSEKKNQKKSTFSHFLTTLKAIFSDSKERTEFMIFVKNILKKRLK